VADLLERDGLIAYEDNPAHRRASLVVPTAEGRAALSRIQKAQRAWAKAVGDEVGARDLQAASAILERVMTAVEALSP
jgi:DNA-binding MarR family transcriptional regulator